jgi:DNA-damage-inducible protein D
MMCNPLCLLRSLLVDRGIKPDLPPGKDLKKLERRVVSDEKKMVKTVALPKGKGDE